MAVRRISAMELELNFFKDSMWRLTNRVFMLEDFIKRKFGDVLTCCSSKNPKGTKRKKPNLKVRKAKASRINLRSKKAKPVSSSSDSEGGDVENASPSKIKMEHMSEPCSDAEESESENDGAQENNYDSHINDGQMLSSNEYEDEDDMDTYIPIAPPQPPVHTFKSRPEPELKVQPPKPNWTHVKDFVNREAAEAELANEWAFKYTLTDSDGTKTTYDCKHEIGTCPAKVRLLSLNNINSVSYFTNNIDHVHSEDAKYGFNFSTKKVIDALMAEGVTEPEPMMKALAVRNIVVEQKFVNRYLGGYKKQLGLFNKSPTAKRLSYTVSFKLQVCEKAEKVGNKEAAREYNIDESNVRNWRKCKSVLEKLEPQRSSLRGKGAKWPSLEKELAQWIAVQKETGEKITTELIRQEAAQIAKRLNLLDFSSSKGWLERFTKRLGESFARRKSKKRVVEQQTNEEPTATKTEPVPATMTTTMTIIPSTPPPIPTTMTTTTPPPIVSPLPSLQPLPQTHTEPLPPPPATSSDVPTAGYPISSWYVEYVQHN